MTMHVERIWPDTKLRNYHYLVVCKQTGEALAVDPFDAKLMLDVARQHGWQITVGSSRVDLQACKLEYSIVSPK